MNNTVFVTGGAGFIGSAVVRQLINDTDWTVVNIDKLTYAGNLASVASVDNGPRYRFEQADICDARRVRGLLREYRPTAIMHLAAESHVDRSIDGPAEFIHTNVVGTGVLLEAAREYWRELADGAAAAFRFHHISTDEVFGSLGPTGYFTETTPYQPRSPYSASKAASDHLVRAWYDTYGLPILVSNCSNNYGPYQFPEKLIPVIIDKALAGQPIPVYGQGANVRDWLYVADHAQALHTILTRGEPGATYNVGGNSERTNLQVVEAVCGVLDEIRPAADGPRFPRLIEYVTDRPGHDFRYAIDAGKIRRELGWQPREDFASGIRKTAEWYLDNHAWVTQVTDGTYRGQRLGLGA